MRGQNPDPPRHGEGDRAKRGGGESKFVPRREVVNARKLRKSMTKPEVVLWQRLRTRPSGLKFRRQHPIGPYVADFCCLSERLVIEVDGSAHDNADRANSDDIRHKFLQENGYRVLRVSARRVLADLDGTVEAIAARVANPLHQPAAGPPPRAGED